MCIKNNIKAPLLQGMISEPAIHPQIRNDKWVKGMIICAQAIDNFPGQVIQGLLRTRNVLLPVFPYQGNQ